MIHQYKLNGFNIVLDVYSGSVHSVDDLAYDVIALIDAGVPDGEVIRQIAGKYGESEAEVAECVGDVRELERQGKLFSPDGFPERVYEMKKLNRDVKALCLHVAHTCNLNCSYCFAGQGKFHGERALMSWEVAKRAIDFLAESSGNRRNLEVDFFGGEPLMNWELVKRTVAYAREIEKGLGKNFRFTLTTNGLLVDDEVIAFCNENMHNVVLSLDGRRETHDRLRKDLGGNGSYDRIVPKLQKFAAARGDRDYYVRGTFTHFNTDFTNDLFHIADLGFTKLSMEPVVCAPGDEYALTEDDLPTLFEQYELLAKEMLRREREGRPITFYHYMIDLGHGPCIYKRLSGCGSGTEYFAVTPWGDLYPCHQFVGDEKYRMGSVFEGVTNAELDEKFRSVSLASRPACRECWAKLYCSGGCAANAYHAAGDVNEVYDYGCKLFKKRMECAIMMKAAEEEAGEQ